MNKFYEVSWVDYHSATVQAESEEEAEEKARDLHPNDTHNRTKGLTADECSEKDYIRGKIRYYTDRAAQARTPQDEREGQGTPLPVNESELNMLAYAYADSCLVAEDSEDREQAIKDEVEGPAGGLEQLQSAYITKFSNYITGGPGYAGTVYLILWDGAPAFVSVAYWEREPKKLRMVHYGND